MNEFYASEAYKDLIQRYGESNLRAEAKNGKIIIFHRNGRFIEETNMTIKSYKSKCYFSIICIEKTIYPNVIIRQRFDWSSIGFRVSPNAIEPYCAISHFFDVLEKTGWSENLIKKIKSSLLRKDSPLRDYTEEWMNASIKDQVV